LHFTDKQFAKLTKGLIPEEMEDKWFIFYENDYLYFHRSWTGFGMYKAHIIKEPEGYSITEFWAERNREKYSNDDDQADIETLSFLIAQGLLGIDVREIYFDQNIKTDTDSVKAWSNFGKLLFSEPVIDYTDKIKSALFGVAIGDALGVPVEFISRQALRKNPVKDMIGNGTHNMPKGTFSDDGSLTFCLAEALTNEFDLDTIGQNFVKWRYDNYWTSGGVVFDIGIATQRAIGRLVKRIKPDLAGDCEESSNGNGSLMRILPLGFYLLDKSINERFEITKQVSSITHGHIRSVIACFYYLEFARQLCEEKDKFEIYKELQRSIIDFMDSLSITQKEIVLFDRLLKGDIFELKEDHILSSGYVLHTLEASIWCLLTTNNYKDAVLKAVNLGDDTDTTAAVTGGLAGLLYGFDTIPAKWIKQLSRKDDIEDLAERLGVKLSNFKSGESRFEVGCK
jgi:ADP-ribosylglycohydrolase